MNSKKNFLAAILAIVFAIGAVVPVSAQDEAKANKAADDAAAKVLKAAKIKPETEFAVLNYLANSNITVTIKNGKKALATKKDIKPDEVATLKVPNCAEYTIEVKAFRSWPDLTITPPDNSRVSLRMSVKTDSWGNSTGEVQTEQTGIESLITPEIEIAMLEAKAAAYAKVMGVPPAPIVSIALRQSAESVSALAWSTDGSKLIVTNGNAVDNEGKKIDDRRVSVWDMASGKVMQTVPVNVFPGNKAFNQRTIGISNNGATIVSAYGGPGLYDPGKPTESSARMVQVYQNGKPLRMLNDYNFFTDAKKGVLAFGPDNKTLLILNAVEDGGTKGSYMSGVALYDTSNGKRQFLLVDGAAEANATPEDRVGFRDAAWSLDGKFVAAAGAKVVRVWDVSNGSVAHNINLASPGVVLAYSADGKMLAVGSTNGAVTIFNMETNAELRKVEGLKGTLMAVGLSHDGKQVMAVASFLTNPFQSGKDSAMSWKGIYETNLKVWDVASGKEVKTMKLENYPGVTAAPPTFSPDGTRLAVASELNEIRVYNLVSGKNARLVVYGADEWAAAVPDGGVSYVANESGLQYVGIKRGVSVTPAAEFSDPNDPAALLGVLSGK